MIPELQKEFCQSTSICPGLPGAIAVLLTNHFSWYFKLVSLLCYSEYCLLAPGFPMRMDHIACEAATLRRISHCCQSFSNERSRWFFVGLPRSVLGFRESETRKPNSDLFTKESHHAFYLPLFKNKFLKSSSVTFSCF